LGALTVTPCFAGAVRDTTQHTDLSFLTFNRGRLRCANRNVQLAVNTANITFVSAVLRNCSSLAEEQATLVKGFDMAARSVQMQLAHVLCLTLLLFLLPSAITSSFRKKKIKRQGGYMTLTAGSPASNLVFGLLGHTPTPPSDGRPMT
jgi:hypothetical protein